MAVLKFKDGADYLLRLEHLSAAAKTDLLGNAVYDGAKVVADTVKAEIRGLPVDNHRGFQDDPAGGPNQYQKKGLEDSFGIAPIRNDNGFVNVKLGFDGYNKVITKNYPKGQPNNLIARACESGSSAMIKQPFMRDAIKKSRGAAEEKMAEIIDAEIKKKMEV